jgi:hypothetical protein
MPFISLAQSNYKPGYVVKLNGDTVKGYIDYQTWNKNPKAINFKTGLDSGTMVNSFSTANILSFTITGADRYTRFVTKISEDAVNGFTVSTVLNTKEDTVFLKILNSGKYVTLYGYTDKTKTRYFIAEKNAPPVELGLHLYADPNAPGETKRSETYKRQLEGYAVTYQPQDKFLLPEIEAAEYTEDDLTKIVFEINGSDKSSTYVSAAKYKYRPVAGLGTNLLSAHKYNSDYSLSYAPAVEINLGEDIFFSKSEGSSFLRTVFEIAYSTGNKIKFSNTDSLLEKFNALTINFNPQLFINIFSENGVNVYLAGGFELFLRTSGKSTYIAQNFEGDGLDVPYPYGRDFSFTTKVEVDLNNNFGINIGYDPVSTIGQKNNTYSTIHAGVNYFFGK